MIAKMVAVITEILSSGAVNHVLGAAAWDLENIGTVVLLEICNGFGRTRMPSQDNAKMIRLWISSKQRHHIVHSSKN